MRKKMRFCDLHIHSIRSTCGFHTLLEIVSIMNAKHIEAFALTDHGPTLETPKPHFSVMLRRVPPVIDGIRVLKGIEASVLNYDGDLDLPLFAGYPYEIILAGLHKHGLFEEPQGLYENTRTLINAMSRNPELNVITHPYFEQFPVDMEALTDAAIETNTALEVNNSYLLNDKAHTDSLALMLELARDKGTPLAVNSDGHVFNEMGEFDLAVRFMEQFGLDRLNIVNHTLESTLAFLELEKTAVTA